MDIHKRYDALLEKIISDREELRRKSKEEGCEDGGDEKVKDFLDILLDVSEQKECEVQLTRNHVKSLILVRKSCFMYRLLFITTIMDDNNLYIWDSNALLLEEARIYVVK